MDGKQANTKYGNLEQDVTGCCPMAHMATNPVYCLTIKVFVFDLICGGNLSLLG